MWMGFTTGISGAQHAPPRSQRTATIEAAPRHVKRPLIDCFGSGDGNIPGFHFQALAVRLRSLTSVACPARNNDAVGHLHRCMAMRPYLSHSIFRPWQTANNGDDSPAAPVCSICCIAPSPLKLAPVVVSGCGAFVMLISQLNTSARIC